MSELPFRFIFIFVFNTFILWMLLLYPNLVPSETIANSEFLPKFLPYLYISFGIGCMSFNDKFLWSSVISFGNFLLMFLTIFAWMSPKNDLIFFSRKELFQIVNWTFYYKLIKAFFCIVKLPFSKKIFRLNCTFQWNSNKINSISINWMLLSCNTEWYATKKIIIYLWKRNYEFRLSTSNQIK